VLKARLYCDNKSTVAIGQNPIASDRSRHVSVKYRKVQEMVENEVLTVEWITTTESPRASGGHLYEADAEDPT
jgi:hypothetical protein